MKRGIITLILLILLVSPLILSADTPADINTPADVNTPKDVLTKVDVGEKVSALKGGIEAGTENVLEREITLSSYLKTPFKILFGIEEKTTWQQLIVVFGMLIGFFILILDLVEVMPFFDTETVKVLASVALTLLISVTGALNLVVTLFLDIAGFFKWSNSWAPLKVIIAIILAIAIILIMREVTSKLRQKITTRTGTMIGEQIHRLSEDAKFKNKMNNI